MRRCFALAAKSAEQGEYPYAAVIVRNGDRRGRDHQPGRA